MDAMSDVEIGQVIDFVEEYNRMHKLNTKSSGKNKNKKEKEPDTVRVATQADWDAFLG